MLKDNIKEIFRQYLDAIVEAQNRYKKSGKVKDAQIKNADEFVDKILGLFKRRCKGCGRFLSEQQLLQGCRKCEDIKDEHRNRPKLR